MDNLEDKNPILNSYFKDTALHIAAIHGRIDVVKYIMSNVLDGIWMEKLDVKYPIVHL